MNKVIEVYWNWEAISALGTWFIGFMASGIAIYPLWLYHWSKNIKILSFKEASDIFHGDGFDVVVYNKTLSPKSITKIEIVKDNKYILTIKDFDIPFIVEPMKAVKIIGDKYVELEREKNQAMGDTYFIINIDEKEIVVKFKGKIIKHNALDRMKKLKRMAILKKHFPVNS